MFVGDKTRSGERRVWINLSVGNTAQATVQFHPIFMQGTCTWLAFLLILPIMIKRQVGPPHELKKRSLSTPFLYRGSEIYIHTHTRLQTLCSLSKRNDYLLQMQWQEAPLAIPRSPSPSESWQNKGGRKAQKPFFSLLIFSLSHH